MTTKNKLIILGVTVLTLVLITLSSFFFFNYNRNKIEEEYWKEKDTLSAISNVTLDCIKEGVINLLNSIEKESVKDLYLCLTNPSTSRDIQVNVLFDNRSVKCYRLKMDDAYGANTNTLFWCLWRNTPFDFSNTPNGEYYSDMIPIKIDYDRGIYCEQIPSQLFFCMVEFHLEEDKIIIRPRLELP